MEPDPIVLVAIGYTTFPEIIYDNVDQLRLLKAPIVLITDIDPTRPLEGVTIYKKSIKFKELLDKLFYMYFYLDKFWLNICTFVLTQ